MAETSADCSWDQDSILTEFANNYMDSFVSNQTLINEIMSFKVPPENLKKDKNLDPYLGEQLADQDKYICLNQNKTLSNFQQIIAFVYEPLTKIWTAMESEKEPCVADERGTIHLLEMPNHFDQVILLLEKAMDLCSY